MDESPVTTILAIANSKHGPSADPEWRSRSHEEHDHLEDADEARRYLARAGLAVPEAAPTAAQLADLRAMRDVARAIAVQPAEMVRAAVEGFLPRHTYRLTGDGGLIPTGQGWEGVAASALPGLLELLAASGRIHTCADPECDWLFLDRSRNHSRQWCDMGICGSRAKMARYRQRKRASAGAGSRDGAPAGGLADVAETSAP